MCNRTNFNEVMANLAQLKAMANSFTKTYVISELPVIPLDQKPTVYNTIGDIFGYGAAIILLIVLIIRGLIAIIK